MSTAEAQTDTIAKDPDVRAVLTPPKATDTIIRRSIPDRKQLAIACSQRG